MRNCVGLGKEPTVDGTDQSTDRARWEVRILLADDEPQTRLFFRLMLRDDSRYEVVGEASDGLEAIEAAARLRPDLCLLDLSMPNCDGMAAIPGIRKASPNTAIVVLSAFERERMEASVRAAGASGYIDKGASPHELMSQVATFIPARDAV
jgi:DNA-binding NarL/FixJ family response regulator